MKTRTRKLLATSLIASAALLTSCASMDDRSTLTPGYEGKMVNDAAYIAAVEHMAAARGVDVRWINPPKVKASDD